MSSDDDAQNILNEVIPTVRQQDRFPVAPAFKVALSERGVVATQLTTGRPAGMLRTARLYLNPEGLYPESKFESNRIE